MEVLRSLEVVEGIVGRRRCACASARTLHKTHHQGKGDLQLLQGTRLSMKTGRGGMIGFSSVKRNSLRKGYY